MSMRQPERGAMCIYILSTKMKIPCSVMPSRQCVCPSCYAVATGSSSQCVVQRFDSMARFIFHDRGAFSPSRFHPCPAELAYRH